ncbi:ANTAR domain-containing protein [Streptomyces sp. 7R007]
MPEPAQSAQPLTTQDTAREEVGGAPPVTSRGPATLHVKPDGDRTTVTVRGELDLDGRRLADRLHDALDRSTTGVDLDLGEVAFCDCSGLNLLLDLRRRALDQSKTVVIRACGPTVERLLELTGTRELFISPGPAERAGPLAAVTVGRHSPEEIDQELLREVVELRRAMRTRPAIDLARGILMASFQLSPEAAWVVLVTTSQRTNTKLHRLAEDLVGTVQGTPLPEAVQRQLALAVDMARASDGAQPA